MLTLPGYHTTEPIYESANSLIYRAIPEPDATLPAETRTVILKMLKGDYPSPERVGWFKREYEVSCGLRAKVGSGVADVYELAYLRDRWVMVFEDFGGRSLSMLDLAGRLDLADFLSLAIDIADILGRLHRHQIVHKDLNPSNIVLNPETGQVKIIDFGISTVLSRETLSFRNPNVLEGTLSYISPEQTGRMNRAVDYRTDFYSLGVTFYELVTGRLPFIGDDSVELVHSHIAKQPPALFNFRPDLPPVISDIILKLMAKNAEDRYQSAHGLKQDLSECLRHLIDLQQLTNFRLELGQQDWSNRLQVPQKLYGREAEISQLLAGFERVTRAVDHSDKVSTPQNRDELMLIAGQAGIGKSALVQEVYQPLTEQRGYFISGKFDQLQRIIPYSALTQAFRGLIRQLLTESESAVAAWREKLLTALKSNGQVIIDVIPEVELIIGPQPPVPELGSAEAQNRFQLTFQNFTRIFAQPEHPLILFIDDLQWADSGSLKLLEILLTAFEIGPLYVIGAYRDNEIDQAHTLHRLRKQTTEAGVPVTQIALGPLAQTDVSRLISDTVYAPVSQVQPLAQLVFEKTGGNPFFTLEFIKALYEDELLTLTDPQSEKQAAEIGWHWDLAQIQARAMTDNVVELLVGKIRRLSPEAQQVLPLAACIGNQFDLQTLAIVAKKSLPAAAANLSQALQEGLILPLDDAYRYVSIVDRPEQIEARYRFAHDRIQQAGYSLIPAQERQTVHWRIGQLLLERISPDQQEERLFNIVHHLNLGRSLIHDLPGTETFAEQLAALNLRAGERAIAATAYGSALSYLQVGISILPPDSWPRFYDLTLKLHAGAAQAAYLTGDFEQMWQYTESVLTHAETFLHKVAVYDLEIEFYIGQSRLRESLRTALQALSLGGVIIPDQPDQADVSRSLAEVQALLAELGDTRREQLAQLLSRPQLTDPIQLATLDILTKTILSSYYLDTNLMMLTTLEGVKLTIRAGHSPATSTVLSFFAILLCIQWDDIEAGYQFSQLALAVQDQFGTAVSRARVFCNTSMVRVWQEHINLTLPDLLEAHQIALETGDLLYASIAVQVYCVRAFLIGTNLLDLEEVMTAYGLFMKRHQQTHNLYYHRAFWQVVLNLLGRSPTPWLLEGEQVDEAMRQEMSEAGFSIGVATLHLCQLMLSYLFQQWPVALDQAAAGGAYYSATTTTIDDVLFYFYTSLARLAVFDDLPEAEQVQLLEQVAETQARLKFWSDHAPANFRHKYWLVEAEVARVSGQNGAAREYYDQAIELARSHGYIQEAALANEVAARFYLAKDKAKIAHLYLREAHYAYHQWGAAAKVADLEQRYPDLFASSENDLWHTSLTTPALTQHAANQLDLTSVLKASQALSGEIVLDRLLSTLMNLLIENAGAQIGYLILQHERDWWIEASGSLESGGPLLTQAIPLQVAAYEQSPRLSAAIVNYVARTRESVVLNEATRQGQFVRDPYIVARQPKSVLAMPLLHQGQLTGILYLENNLTNGAFTPARLEVLRLLSSQAAISIENARLYTDLQSSEVKYRTIFETSNDVIYLASPDGQIIDINQAGLDLLGYDKAELLHRQSRDFYIQPGYYADFRRRLESDGLVKDMEIRYRHKRGRVIICLESATIRQAEDGTLLGYQGIIRDITALKQAEHERLRLIAIERDLTLAQDIQQNLLPQPQPDWPALDVICYSIPAREMGGDFYAYYVAGQPDSLLTADPTQPHYTIVVGDVTDKGIPAALLMAVSLSSFRSIVAQVSTPAELLARLDDAIIDYTRTSRQNCALVYLGLDRSGTTLYAANAGCIAPFIKRCRGAVEQLDVGGIPLGIELGRESGYQTLKLSVERGDIIVLTSDGVIEAQNGTGQMFGFERWAATIEAGPTDCAEAMLNHLRQAVLNFMGDVEQHDDITIVVVRV